MECLRASSERPGSLLLLSDSLGSAAVGDSYLSALASGAIITASLVVDRRGETRDAEGGSKLLGGETDLLWLRTLRGRANLVVTGGKTYRAEHYKMPRNADLAVFSRSELTAPSGFEDSPRFIAKVGEGLLLAAEVRGLAENYRNLHLEFGAETMLPLTRQLGIGIWVSSEFEQGIESFCEANNLKPLHTVRVQDLLIAYCR